MLYGDGSSFAGCRAAYVAVHSGGCPINRKLRRVITNLLLIRRKRLGLICFGFAETADLMEKAVQNEKDGSPYDPLEIVLRLADKKSMRVVVDLPQCGWYGKAEPEEVIKKVEEHIQTFWKRYGKHRCLYGWYLNFEINPLAPDEKEESSWWREVWSGITMCCHRVSPHSVVTISPFFILDDENRRGFKYLTPKNTRLGGRKPYGKRRLTFNASRFRCGTSWFLHHGGSRAVFGGNAGCLPSGGYPVLGQC